MLEHHENPKIEGKGESPPKGREKTVKRVCIQQSVYLRKSEGSNSQLHGADPEGHDCTGNGVPSRPSIQDKSKQHMLHQRKHHLFSSSEAKARGHRYIKYILYIQYKALREYT